MHLMQVVFLAILLAALTAAFSRGGRPERIGAVLLFIASIVTPMVQRHLFRTVEWGIWIVDLLLFGALLWMAFTGMRRWPSYAAAFQALGVMTHLARVKAGPIQGDSYGTLLVLWSYLVVLALLFGSLIEPEGRTMRRPLAADRPVPPTRTPVPTPSPSLPASQDDLALLSQLLSLHGIGPASEAIAAQLLTRSGSFAAALAMPASQMAAMGLDPRVHDALHFARTTTQTALKRNLETRPCLADKAHVIDYLHAELAHLQIEQFRVLYLNARRRLILEEIHGQGTINAAPVFPREIVRRAIEVGAVELILAHNHPAGDPAATRSDIQTTRAVIDATRAIGIAVADHLIISSSGHTSMRASGLI